MHKMKILFQIIQSYILSYIDNFLDAAQDSVTAANLV